MVRIIAVVAALLLAGCADPEKAAQSDWDTRYAVARGQLLSVVELMKPRNLVLCAAKLTGRPVNNQPVTIVWEPNGRIVTVDGQTARAWYTSGPSGGVIHAYRGRFNLIGELVHEAAHHVRATEMQALDAERRWRECIE